MLSCFSRVQLCATSWTAARQAPLSTGFSRQEYWSGLPFPSPIELSLQFHFWNSKRIESRELNRYLHIHIHSNIIHNIQRVETTYTSVWDEQNVVYIYTTKYHSVLNRNTKGTPWRSSVWDSMFPLHREQKLPGREGRRESYSTMESFCLRWKMSGDGWG